MPVTPHDNPEFYARVGALKAGGRPFAVATVIHVKGSASAKAGSKAIIDEHGQNILGWVGGGCAETFVAENAVAAMADGRTRIVQADLDDEIFGLGMPCGGIMDVFIEPFRAPEKIFVGAGPEERDVLSHLAATLGVQASFVEQEGSILPAPAVERALYALAEGLARARGRSFQSLRAERGVYRGALNPPSERNLSELLVLGSSRITEELASWGATARWPVRIYGRNLDPALYPRQVTLQAAASDYEGFLVKPGSAVIVASHHKGDH
jgi:xanthine/CO dehydrogenase XdhC/CoxF family maturation factor